MSEVAIRHEQIQGDGVRLHAAVAGEGPPVILLHGFPENWRSWRRQMGALAAAGFSAWAPDLRGYNLSEKPAGREPNHLRHLVEDVAAVVRATGHARAHVVGHDWGGIIAWTFAGQHPELLHRLAILNPPHLRLYMEQVRRPPQMFRSSYVLFFQLPVLPERALSRGDFAAVRKMFRSGPAVKDAFPDGEIEQYVRALAAPGALTAALNYYRTNLTTDGLKLAREAVTDAETLVLWGELDPALDLRLLDGIERVAPKVRVHRLPGISHWIQNEAPEEVNRALIDFLRG
ncbi:MAG TPA: alpha/beta hydrolase [Armatimonadota bacterium]|nr:alpha/beta hydrolase [Armatimonadota bacterium]